MYDYKVYTNDHSNQIMQAKRPNAPVENLLMSSGLARQIKIKKMEHELYGKERVPTITKKGHKVQHNENVYNRYIVIIFLL